MASSMRKLAPQLVTLSPPPTPKDVYKLLGVSEGQSSGPTPKDVHRLLGVSGGLDTHPQKCCLLQKGAPPQSKVRMILPVVCLCLYLCVSHCPCLRAAVRRAATRSSSIENRMSGIKILYRLSVRYR